MLDKNQIQYLVELHESYPNSADLINFLQNGKTKHYSFWTLINKYEIEIPIIQRDYAQGRSDGKSSQIRTSFVNSITHALKEKENLHLDFIYGSSKHDSPLVLLDGQQRITTLFLLHWYILYKLGKLDEFKVTMQRFSYKTRISSKEFCLAIINNAIRTESLTGKTFAELIKNQAWFFRSWEKDPTIKGMLVMLDAINKSMDGLSATELEQMWHSLTQDDLIDFQFLNLDDFELTDELYIKMNARGKTLTNFENFKAWLIQNLESEEIKPENWCNRLDLEWTDLFWSHKADEDYEIDTEYMQYFRGMSQFNFALSLEDNELSVVEKDKLSELIESMYVPYALYQEYQLFSPLNVTGYFNILECLEGENIEVLKEILDTKENSIFKKFIDNPNYWERTVFFALCSFLWKAELNPISYDEKLKENLRQWMRVLQNLINNTTIDDPVAFVKAINEINRLSHCYKSVYSDLANDLQIKFFSENQKQEERLKAKLILNDSNWESEIIKYEKHDYFYGQIEFLLDYSLVESNYNLEMFKRYAEKASELFSNYLNSPELLLERALLTKGNGNDNYLVKKNSNLCFCLPSTGTLRQREENWRRVFRDKDVNRGHQCLKYLLDDSRSLHQIINDADIINDWRKYVIKEPQLIQYCNQRMIRKDNDTYIRLLGSSRLSHYHVELYTYYLYFSLKTQQALDGLVLKYTDVRGENENAHLSICDWKFKRKTYSLELYYDESKDSFMPNPFEIRFFKTEGKMTEDQYDDELKSDLLKGFSFHNDADWRGYWFSVKTIDAARSFILKFSEKLIILNK
jgi:hypothetical protein